MIFSSSSIFELEKKYRWDWEHCWNLPHHLKDPYSIPSSFHSYIYNHPTKVTINAFKHDCTHLS